MTPTKLKLSPEQRALVGAVRDLSRDMDFRGNSIKYMDGTYPWENLDALSAAHAAGKTIKKDNALKGMPVPLHPGAEKYYREVGMLK